MNLFLCLSAVTCAELQGFHEMQSAATGLKIQKEKEKNMLPSSTQPSHAWASNIQEHGHYQEHGRSETQSHSEVLTNKNQASSSQVEVLTYYCNWKCKKKKQLFTLITVSFIYYICLFSSDSETRIISTTCRTSTILRAMIYG